MDRRKFLKDTSLILFAGWLAPVFTFKAYAEPVQPSDFLIPNADHLKGVIPPSASPAVSSRFVFRHHHYVYIPQSILENPPEDGYLTTTSMVIPKLGVGQQLIDQKRHFHYHVIEFTSDQIRSIARGTRTTVDLMLAGKLNHRFVFNDSDSFADQVNTLAEDAKDQGFATKLSGTPVPRRIELD
jgi:hypothetical protein